MFCMICLGLERAVTYKDRINMPYVEAVLLETLRKGNIASTAMPHTVDKDIIVDGVVCMQQLLFL